MKDLEKSRADSAAQSHEGYKENLEKSHDDSVAWSHESYLKDPEESRAQNHVSYMKELEKSRTESEVFTCVYFTAYCYLPGCHPHNGLTPSQSRHHLAWVLSLRPHKLSNSN